MLIRSIIIFAMVFACFNAMASVVDDIAAMPDNSWLRLPTDGAQPTTSSSSPTMFFDGDSMAYKWGTCHTGSDNDVWGYNLAANNWRQMYPCDPSVVAQPASVVVRDSILMTETGHPLSFHQWSLMDWDPVNKRLWWSRSSGWQGIYSGILDTITKYHPDSCVMTANKVMWDYNPAANQWTPHKLPNPYPLVYYNNSQFTFRYIPYLKKFIGIHNTAYGDGYFTFFDPESMTLTKKLVNFDTLPGDFGAEYKFDFLCMGAVYDTRHDLLIATSVNSGAWAYDPKTNHFSELTLPSATPPVYTDCPVSYMVWDSWNEKVIVFVTAGGQACYNAGAAYGALGWPSTGTHVFAFDYDNRRWDMLPAPTSGDNPDNIWGEMGYTYFDPRFGVLFHMAGSYCQTGGERWVYKYGNGTSAEANGVRRNPADPLTIRPSVFSGSAVISTDNSVDCRNASLKVFSLDGRMARDFSSRIRLSRSVVLNPDGLRSGVYVVRLIAGEHQYAAKASFIK